jgi:hypothetical protein
MSSTHFITQALPTHQQHADLVAVNGHTPIDAPVQMWCMPDGHLVSGTEAMRTLAEEGEPDAVVRRFGDWVVTSYGLQCISRHYEIAASRLWENDWVRHLAEKNWPVISHFACALEFARAYHRTNRQGGADG